MKFSSEAQSSFLTPYEITHGKRLEKNCYTSITNKVASLYSKVCPRGCSQNTKVQYEDVEKAKNFVKSKEKCLKDFQVSELSKLNFPLIKKEPQPLSHKQKRAPKASARYCLIIDHDEINHPTKFKSLDKVIDQCNVFHPQLGPVKKNLLSQTCFRMSSAKNAVNYIQDLSDCMRSSSDPEAVENMLSTLTYNRKLSEKLKADMRLTGQDLLETTEFIRKMGNYKLWRQDNISFMTATDKLISSFSSINQNS